MIISTPAWIHKPFLFESIIIWMSTAQWTADYVVLKTNIQNEVPCPHLAISRHVECDGGWASLKLFPVCLTLDGCPKYEHLTVCLRSGVSTSGPAYLSSDNIYVSLFNKIFPTLQLFYALLCVLVIMSGHSLVTSLLVVKSGGTFQLLHWWKCE